MRLSAHFTALFFLFLFSTQDFCHAQKRGNFDYYQGAPEKYLNQKITIFIMSVDTPAINSGSKDDNYRIFSIYTSSQDGSDTSFGYAKVPFSKSEEFVKRYNQSQGQGTKAFTPRNATGVFRHGEDGDNYLAKRYYLDMTGN